MKQLRQIKRAYARTAAVLAIGVAAFGVQAAEILPMTGVFGDENGCTRYFGGENPAGVSLDRAGVEGYEWYCQWHQVSESDYTFSNSGAQYRMDVGAVCFAEGDGQYISGALVIDEEERTVRLEMPEIYPETTLASCVTP